MQQASNADINPIVPALTQVSFATVSPANKKKKERENFRKEERLKNSPMVTKLGISCILQWSYEFSKSGSQISGSPDSAQFYVYR